LGEVTASPLLDREECHEPHCGVDIGFGLVACRACLGLGAAKVNPEQAQAIAEIKKLGGKVTVDEGILGKPRFCVDLSLAKVIDAGLEHLKGLTKLQGLHPGGPKITDAGLEHLQGLTKFQRLTLMGTKVTDKGVKKLQQALPACQIAKLP
jgi:hypothetical protein